DQAVGAVVHEIRRELAESVVVDPAVGVERSDDRGQDLAEHGSEAYSPQRPKAIPGASNTVLLAAQRSVSRPTVRPGGRSRTRSSARRTPGTNASREVVSWRIVSVWPRPPRITSWCATRPGSRIEWMGTSPAMPAAVALAVPEGASSFVSW